MAETIDDLSVKADLLTWALDIYPTEAATQLQLHAFDGRFTRFGWPWITSLDRRHTRLVIDALAYAAGDFGYLPGSTDSLHRDLPDPTQDASRRPIIIEPTGMTQ